MCDCLLVHLQVLHPSKQRLQTMDQNLQLLKLDSVVQGQSNTIQYVNSVI